MTLLLLCISLQLRFKRFIVHFWCDCVVHEGMNGNVLVEFYQSFSSSSRLFSVISAWVRLFLRVPRRLVTPFKATMVDKSKCNRHSRVTSERGRDRDWEGSIRKGGLSWKWVICIQNARESVTSRLSGCLSLLYNETLVNWVLLQLLYGYDLNWRNRGEQLNRYLRTTWETRTLTAINWPIIIIKPLAPLRQGYTG